jgi:hypothetical protein
MWEIIFLEKEQINTGFDSLLSEINLVGRCVEKILQVEMCPVTFPAATSQFNDATNRVDQLVQGHAESEDDRRLVALVSNLFTHPNVDLKGVFWKTRFLIKLYHFMILLSQQGEMPMPATSRGLFCRVDTDTQRRHMIVRLRTGIERVVRFLIATLLTVNEHRECTLMPDTFVPGESNYYYVLMTIWYAVKHKCLGLDIDVDNIDWCHLEQTELFTPTRLPDADFNFAQGDKEKVALLKWYHCGSQLNLAIRGGLDDKCKNDLKSAFDVLGKAAKIASAAKLSSKRLYEADDEIFDRLALLVSELAFHKPEPDLLHAEAPGAALDPNATVVASLTIKRLKQRSLTTTVNPAQRQHLGEGSTSAPWEVYALCHHSRLMAMSMELSMSEHASASPYRDTDEFEKLKEKVCFFLNSEGTLVPCWERAFSKASRSWLRSESTAVFASTVIDTHRMLLMQGASHKVSHKICERCEVPSDETKMAKEDSGITSGGSKQNLLIQERRFAGIQRTLDQLVGQLQLRTPPSVDWITIFAPPAKYHPDSFVNSLADTSWIFDPAASSQSPANVEGFLEKYAHRWKCPDTKNAKKTESAAETTGSTIEETRFLSTKGLEALLRAHPHAVAVRDIATFENSDDTVVSSGGMTSPHPPTNGVNLAQMLNHNLVGRGVEHRYLLVKYFPKGIFDYLVYVLQPEAAPCFTNHALNLSRFSCRGRNKWIADVTLKTWCVQSNIKSFGINDIPQIPRLTIRGANDKVVSGSMDDYLIKLSESSGIFLKVSTITMLTNPFGDFSKCLVISSILVDSDLDDVAHEASQLWHTFAHHPRTARCLAFLLVLGRLCSKMSQECRRRKGERRLARRTTTR